MEARRGGLRKAHERREVARVGRELRAVEQRQRVLQSRGRERRVELDLRVRTGDRLAQPRREERLEVPLSHFLVYVLEVPQAFGCT